MNNSYNKQFIGNKMAFYLEKLSENEKSISFKRIESLLGRDFNEIKKTISWLKGDIKLDLKFGCATLLMPLQIANISLDALRYTVIYTGDYFQSIPKRINPDYH